MTNYLLNGTNWHWRQGLKPMPIHCSKEDALSFRTQELYTLVQTMDQAKKILEELQQNEIKAEVKRTHSPHDIIPAGSLIVYSYIPDEDSMKHHKENIDKLKAYIITNGGKINEKTPFSPTIRHFIRNLFGRR